MGGRGRDPPAPGPGTRAELTAQASDLARAAEQAVLDERQRIARELHDVVSHAISVTVLHARGGRRLLDADHAPADVREAFTVIERTNAQAMGDMRRLLGLLRDSAGDAGPSPSLTTVDSLVSTLRASGLAVEFELTGDLSLVPPGIGLSAYRIVQEALTNVLRHAAGASARVAIASGERDVTVCVTDDGSTVDSSRGGGHGLIGMRERTVVAGGTFEAGPGPAGGFQVKAVLPYEVTG